MPVTILFQDPHRRDSRFLILDLRPIKGRVENEILAVTDFDLIDETRKAADVRNEEKAAIFHSYFSQIYFTFSSFTIKNRGINL
jgi:hypothetical protein